MSGVYNYWLKVNYPDLPNDIVQMESGGFQKPFYFGGSQVPVNLKMKDDGIISPYHVVSHMKKGQGIERQTTYHQKHHNIYLPRHI